MLLLVVLFHSLFYYASSMYSRSPVAVDKNDHTVLRE